MQISSLPGGYPDPAAWSKRNDPAEAAGGPRAQAPTSQTTPETGTTAVLREIVARYDVTDISARQFSEMIHELYQAGALTDQQFQELSLIRLDLDLDGVEPDEPLDLIEFYAHKLKKLQQGIRDLQDSPGLPSAEGPPEVGSIAARFGWIEKFALIQSAPEAIGLDALA